MSGIIPLSSSIRLIQERRTENHQSGCNPYEFHQSAYFGYVALYTSLALLIIIKVCLTVKLIVTHLFIVVKKIVVDYCSSAFM